MALYKGKKADEPVREIIVLPAGAEKLPVIVCHAFFDPFHHGIDIRKVKIKAAAVNPASSAELTDRDLRKFLFLQKLQEGIRKSLLRLLKAFVPRPVH
jgi:hypothetical protein